MILNDQQTILVQQIIRDIYTKKLDEDFLFDLAPLIGSALTGQYFGALLFPNRYSPRKMFITNNHREFNDVYLPMFSKDFLMNHLVETNSPSLYKQLEHFDFPGKREFLAETQKVRPCGDCFYVPLNINNNLAGFLAIGREGVNCPPFTRNDLKVFSFLSCFIVEGFKRTLYSEPERENAALINAYGQVTRAGGRIRSAFSELFGERFCDCPGRGLCENSYRFGRALIRFLDPLSLPGSGDLYLEKQGERFHLIFRNLPELCYRPYFPLEPQISVILGKEEDNPETGDLLDFALLERLYELTSREKDVIRCIYRGLSNKDIGLELKISEGTVKRHIWNIFNKTGADNRTQLIFQFSSPPAVR